MSIAYSAEDSNNGWRAELVTAPDCKSGVLRHTGFESLATHQDAQRRLTLWQDGLSMLATKPLKLRLESSQKDMAPY